MVSRRSILRYANTFRMDKDILRCKSDIYIPRDADSFDDIRINVTNLLADFYDYAPDRYVRGFRKFYRDNDMFIMQALNSYMESRGFTRVFVIDTSTFDNDFTYDFGLVVYAKDPGCDYVYTPSDADSYDPSMIVAVFPAGGSSYMTMYENDFVPLCMPMLCVPANRYEYSMPIYSHNKVQFAISGGGDMDEDAYAMYYEDLLRKQKNGTLRACDILDVASIDETYDVRKHGCFRMTLDDMPEVEFVVWPDRPYIGG